MANFTKNITNAVNVFGNGPSTKWGQDFGITYTMAWGSSLWGEGARVITRSDWAIVVTNSVLSSFDYYRSDVKKIISNSVDVLSENGSETLQNGNWSYVFVSDTPNAEGRDFVNWTQGSGSSVSFACQAAASTSWSED